MKSEVLAVIVTYNPPDNFSENLREVAKQVAEVLIVDNASTINIALLHDAAEAGISVLFNATNLGVATALNQGFRWAAQCGFDYVLTLDQDSSPASEMVQKLLEVYKSHPETASIAIVAPNIIDSAVGIFARHLRSKRRFFFELVTCEHGLLDDAVFVITSGSLCNLSAYQTIGGFQDDLFIDYIDIEYCLHARALGYKIIVLGDALLVHSLGAREERQILGKKEYPRFHSPLRWYYQSRNKILVLKKYLLENPFLFFYEGMGTVYGVLRMLLFEDQRLQKIAAIFRGSLDAFLGKVSVFS